MKHEFKFNNGDQVKEIITGFKGTITGMVKYMTGCNQYLVTGKSKDNAEAPGLWYDESRLILTKGGGFILPEDTEDGCDIVPSKGKRGA